MTIFWPFKNKQTASRGSAEAVGATLLARQVLHLRSEGYVSLGVGVSWDFTKLPRKMVCFPTAPNTDTETVWMELFNLGYKHLRIDGMTGALGFIGFCQEITKKNGDFMGFE